MKSIKIAKTILVLLSGIQLATAQERKTELYGQVGDSLTKGALPNATVILKGKDTTFHSLSSVKGSFHFKDLPTGTYTLSVVYIGYKPYTKNEIVIDGSKTAIPADIYLALDQQQLKGVSVAGAKPFIVQRLDKVVLNVAESPIAAGGNAYDVVLRAPGVAEKDGLQFRGKKVIVLVDGRNTNLTGDNIKEYLSAMPSNGVERIEVIPNPSAKYDAAGGAVINIITAKNKKLGTNGVVTLGVGAGTYARYNAGASINYRNNKLNLYGGYDYLHAQSYMDNTSNRLMENITKINEDEHEVRTRNNHTFKAGMDYDINSKNTFGIFLRGMYNTRDRDDMNHTDQRGPGTEPSYSTVATDGHATFYNPAVNIYYKSMLDSTGKMLIVNADYLRYDKTINDDILTRYFNSEMIEQYPSLALRNNSPTNNTIKSVTVDYVHPSKLARFEAGLKVNFNTIDNDIIWQQQAVGKWLTDSAKTNHFIYKENINALYLNASRTFGKFETQAGIRAEQTNTEGISVTTGQTDKNSYLNFFPSLSVQFNQSEKQQFGFSYQEKIDRPKFDILNPFIIYRSQYSYFQGNPYLSPSISHNFELSYAYNNQWMAAFTYQHHQKVVADIFKKAASGDAVISTFENVSSGDYVDGNVTYSLPLLHNKWTSINTLGGFYAKYNSTSDLQLNSAQVTGYFSSNNIIQLPQSFKLEVNGRYYSAQAFGMYHFDPSYAVDMGLSKTMLKKTATVSLSVSDIFNTFQSKYSILSSGLNMANVAKAESRFVKLQLTYKLGNKNVKASTIRSSSIETEKQRIESN
ncbi:outer membrane beta-barrel protein [Chitinophaga sp. Hz27]|uniref:outer membrane beta-barrel protein n=1 Tax=Chitinophaga sp. Hz27 TaxID=3347169 RepID=UPI0035D97FC0